MKIVQSSSVYSNCSPIQINLYFGVSIKMLNSKKAGQNLITEAIKVEKAFMVNAATLFTISIAAPTTGPTVYF